MWTTTTMMRVVWICAWLLGGSLNDVLIVGEELHGPMFVAEPPTNVDFSNSTGVTVRCIVSGNPYPSVQWILRDDRPVTNLPGLRHSDSNGTLLFLPFRAEDYRQDVHATTYRCLATNSLGTIISTDVTIRAVVNQLYEANVYDDFVIKGNSAVLKCHIPSFVMDYVSVISWVAGDSTVIDSTLDSGNRYSIMPGGELHIRDVHKEDSRYYRCRTFHRLTGESKLSNTAGRLMVTVPQGTVPPRLVSHKPSIVGEHGKTVVLPCIAQGFPIPMYSWVKKLNKVQQIPLALDDNMELKGGSLIIKNANSQNSGVYVCLVNNSVGTERVETNLVITESIGVVVHPVHHIVQVGQAAVFACSVSGHPIHFIRWVKNGRPLKSEQSFHNKPEVLRIASAQKGDSGMYQCFAGNEIETVQATLELRLGDAAPSMQLVFKEEIHHPGSDASFRCSAYGNPSPNFHWTLDGESLPSARFAVNSFGSPEGDIVSELNISNVRTEDSGELACIAHNKVGLVSHAARLNIYGSPFIRRMQRISSVAGKDIVVKCAYGGFPIESISWKKDGKLLPVEFRQEVTLNGTLIIRQALRVVDSGKYTCIVRNPKDQEAQQQVEIRIMIPPMIDPSTFQGHNLYKGAHARLTCGVTGGDLPIKFTWVKDGKDILTDLGAVMHSIDEFSNVLTIKNVTTSHMGKFTCIAKNAAGASNYTTSLTVQVPPEWKVVPEAAKLVVGASVTLNCQADGFPRPEISWMKVIGNVPTGERYELRNNSKLSILKNGSLHISGVHSSDEGYYFCLADNGILPFLSKMIYLNIRSPAKFDIRYRQQAARKGKDAALTCQAVGDSPLSFMWSKEDHDMDVTLLPERYKIDNRKIPNGAMSILTIQAALRDDSGVFKCKVRNEYGQDSASFHLMIVEPPEAPNPLKIVGYSSRTVTLSWTKQYDGNSPILKYQIEGKLASADWNKPLLLMASLGADNSAEVDGLLPATKYTFRIYAENDVGNSPASEPVSGATDEEAPSGPPQDVRVRAIDSETLLVTWKPPIRSLWNGDLVGYHVGYRMAESTKPYLYKTLDVPINSDSSLSMELQNLGKFTKYSIVVRAFNRVGLGPVSAEVLELTAEDVPTQSPHDIECHPESAENLQVSWKAPPNFGINGVLQGYKVLYRPVEEWYDARNIETKSTTAMRTSLHGLKKYTNYSIQVLSYTRVGDGIRSEPIFCRTREDVPGPPSEIKALALSSDTILVTWKHPVHPNGVLTKYSVYVRVAGRVKEATNIESLPASSTYYYAKGAKEGERYEFWVTASTSIGEGLSTPVVSQRVAGSVVSARVASFGESFIVRQGKHIALACLAVGVPQPSHQWIFKNEVISLTSRHELHENGSLVIRNIISSDAGNYTCKIHNSYSSDQVTYVILVQEPPPPPNIDVSAIAFDMISIKWSLGTENGIPVKGIIIHFKRDFGEWEERFVPPQQSDFILDGLDCGTRYHVYVSAKNDIGIGKPSQVASIKTEGTAPRMPSKHKLLEENSTSLTLHLESWEIGVECPILYFVVEHKMLHSRNWTLVSNNVQPQHLQFTIPDLTPATWYSLKMTAHNSAGSTIAIYDFATLTVSGGTVATIIAEMSDSDANFFDWNFYLYVLLSVGSLLAVIILLFLMAFAFRNRKRRRQTNTLHEEKPNKNATYAPCNVEKYERTSTPTSFTYLMRNKDRPSSGSRQVSDTSTKVSEEDICPYATFQIPDRKTKSFTDELKAFGEHSPDHQSMCSIDPRLENMYVKVRNTALHPCRSNYAYPKSDDCIPVTSSNPEEDLIVEHLTESSLELHMAQGCMADGCDQHVPDLLYHGPESGSSNDTSPLSTCSFDRRHIRLLNLSAHQAADSYNGRYVMEDESERMLHQRRGNSRPHYYLEDEEDKNTMWFKENGGVGDKCYKHCSLEINPIDSTC